MRLALAMKFRKVCVGHLKGTMVKIRFAKVATKDAAMNDPTPNFAQWILLLSLAVYGLWIAIKGWQQFRDPDGVKPFGLGWMTDWSQEHPTGEHSEPPKDSWSYSGFVRFWGLLLMIAGGAALLLPLFILLITR